MRESKVIAWWSGGITSAVASKICIDIFGSGMVRIIFIDTKNEDPDTYRFKKDCEEWYGIEIETITAVGEGEKYENIQAVWRKYKSLNVAHGAICSSELKRAVRLNWQKENKYLNQAFGFEFDPKEMNRAISMSLNYPEAKPIFPLLMKGYNKSKCIDLVKDAGIKIPDAYKRGYNNNNCLGTGCIQGGIGYWQKIRREEHDKFLKMAKMEHELTDSKGKPVTMLKDQSKEAKQSARFHVFLLPHPDYPEYKDLSMMKGREPKPLMDCNGFCGINDISKRNPTELEINFEGSEDQLHLF